MSAREGFAYEEDPTSQPTSGRPDLVEEALSALRRISAYLSGHQLATMRRDLEKRVREHPGTTIAIGFGIGLILGKLIRR